MYVFIFLVKKVPPREAGCFDLGGCSISEVNKPCNGETGSVFFFIFISNRNALRGVKKEHIAHIHTNIGTRCIKWIWTEDV